MSGRIASGFRAKMTRCKSRFLAPTVSRDYRKKLGKREIQRQDSGLQVVDVVDDVVIKDFKASSSSSTPQPSR